MPAGRSSRRPTDPRSGRRASLVRLERVRPMEDPGLDEQGHHISLTWFKTAIGVLLLPACWIATVALFDVFQSAEGGSLWQTRELFAFSTGVMLWVGWFLLLPRPVGLYVLGHEWTHAFFSLICGGRVADIKATRHGGYVLTDKNNVLISLSPYFIPFWSLVSLAILGGMRFAMEIPWFDVLLFGCAGITWAFHISFTLLMMGRGQSDLESNGYFFSLVFIYLCNVLLIAGFLIVASPSAGLADFGRSAWNELLHLLQSASHLFS